MNMNVMPDLYYTLYLVAYVIEIVYLVVLGCVMLLGRNQAIYTRGELEVKQRMNRSVGIYMFTGAFECLIYLPFLLLGFTDPHWVYGYCFLVTLTINTSMVFVTMWAVLQKKVNLLRWVSAIAAPFIILTVLYAFIPKDGDYMPLLYVSGALSVAMIFFMLAGYAREYRQYVARVRMEYSETSEREIIWSWSCFAGFALQSIIFVVYEFCWNMVLEVLYVVITAINAAYLCYCTYRQRPLDISVVEETPAEEEKKVQKPADEKAFYAVIEQRLESLCEGKLLFLEPDLTRETLCLRLNIGRTYLGMYLHSRGLTFYQYINTLRVEYAINLMQKNPEMPIREVSELSGFRSQTTFRKVFKEVMGCLPSDIHNSKIV